MMRTMKCFFFSGLFVMLFAISPFYVLVDLACTYLICPTDEAPSVAFYVFIFCIALICSVGFFILAIDKCDRLGFWVRQFLCASKIWGPFCSDSLRLKLANAYYNGVGTDRNPKRAFELFNKIATGPKLTDEVAYSQYQLGVMAMNGDGCPLDLQQAKIWLKEVESNSINRKSVAAPVDVYFVRNFIEQSNQVHLFNSKKRNYFYQQCHHLLEYYLSNNQLFLKTKKKLEEIEEMEQASQLQQLQETEKNAQEEANKQMLSYLTHTLRNSLGTGPETVRQTIRLLQGEYHKDMPHYKAINNMVSLLTTFLLIDTLIQTFKQYISDQKAFRSAWQQDSQGKGSIELVTALALRQALSRILFQLHEKLEDLLPPGTNLDLKNLRDSFMTEVVMLELSPERTEQVFAWLKPHLDVLELDLEQSKGIYFGENKTRFNFLFSVISELLFNAFKYSDGQSRVELVWKTEESHHCLICRNHFNPDLRHREQGSQKGLLFVEKLMGMLKDSRVERFEQNGVFTVQLIFSKAIFEETV